MRLSYLDSSRGLAAFFVLLSHFQFTMLPSLSDSWLMKTPLKLLADGPAAVLYFFLLSGYVLTLSLMQEEELTFKSYVRFAVKRILRIFPAFIFTLLVTYIIINSIEQRPQTWLDRFWTSKPDLLSLLKQSILIVRYPYDPELRLIPQDWTLTIEIAVSLIMPALAVILKRKSLFALFFIYFTVQYLGLDPFVFDFSLGVFLAINKEKIISVWKNSRFKSLLILLAVFLVCGDYVFPQTMVYFDIVLLHHKTWGLLILLCGLLSSESAQRILSMKPLVFLGRISYSLYLLHLVILLCMTFLFPDLSTVYFFLVFVSLTIFVSAISYFRIEIPFNRLGKGLVQR